MKKLNIDKPIQEKKRREDLKRLESQGYVKNLESIEENKEENLEEEQGQAARHDKQEVTRKTLREIEEMLEKSKKSIERDKNRDRDNSDLEVGLER